MSSNVKSQFRGVSFQEEIMGINANSTPQLEKLVNAKVFINLCSLTDLRLRLLRDQHQTDWAARSVH